MGLTLSEFDDDLIKQTELMMARALARLFIYPVVSIMRTMPLSRKSLQHNIVLADSEPTPQVAGQQERFVTSIFTLEADFTHWSEAYV